MSNLARHFCFDCQYAEHFDHFVHCHRFPPVLKKDRERTWTVADWDWPLLRESDWCGEWQSDIEP